MTQLNKGILVIISEAYPFDRGDLAWIDEFAELNKNYREVLYFPVQEIGQIKEMPSNTRYFDTLINPNFNSYSFFQLLKIFIYEIIYNQKKLKVIANARQVISSIKIALIYAEVLEKKLNTLNINPNEITFYCPWLNNATLALAQLKMKNRIKNFVFRVNGFDFIDDRRKEGVVFFRQLVSKQSKKVIALSTYAKSYLIEKKISPEKIIVNHGGKHLQNDVNKLKVDGKFTIVSCSKLRKLKRVDLLAKAIIQLNFDCKWVHFGDGPESSMIEQIIQNKKQHIEVVLKGNVPQQEIFDFYRDESINVFVHLSETEGLGMALIEALNYGIPVLACGVEGVLDIVNSDNGKLLKKTISSSELVEILEWFKNSPMNDNSVRKIIQKNIQLKFDVEKNVQELTNILNN